MNERRFFEFKHFREYPHEDIRKELIATGHGNPRLIEALNHLLKKLFENLISEDKIKKKIKEYQTFVLKDIFSEYTLKDYINGIEKIVQKNDGCHKNNK